MKKKQQKRQTERFVSTEIKKNNMTNEDYQRVKTFVIILVIVVALVGLLFVFNGKIVTKDLSDNKTTAPTTEPSYDESIILADDIFSKSDKEYMVLIYDSSNKESGILFNGLFNYYKGSTKIYGVDLANKMNSSHYSESLENENTKPSKASEIIVSGPRLLIIKNKEVKEYISDTTTITEKLSAK